MGDSAISFRWFSHGLVPLGLATLLIVPFVLPHWILGAGWWYEFFDLAHFFSFAALAALCLSLSKPFKGNTLAKTIYLMLFILGVSVATELIQHYLYADRSGSVDDVIRNCLGAIAAVAAYVAFYAPIGKKLKILSALITSSLLLWALTPLASQWFWQQKREQQLPILYDFDEQWELQHVSWTNARAIAQSEWQKQKGATLMCPEEIWSGIRVHRLWPRWHDYQQLNVKLNADMNVTTMPLQLYVAFVSSFQQKKVHWGIAYTEIERGDNTLNIPFSEILLDGQKIDFENVRVQFLDIYKPEQQAPLTVTIKEISLNSVTQSADKQ